MQSGEPAATDGQDSAPTGEETGGELTDAILSESSAQPTPLFQGKAPILWTTAGAAMAIFLIIIILIMRMHARAAAKRAARRNPAQKDFFQPAGEGAEIRFEDEEPSAELEEETPPRGDDGTAQEITAVSETDRIAAADRQAAPDETGRRESQPKPRGGLAGLFGGQAKQKGESSTQERGDAKSSDTESALSVETREPLRASRITHEGRDEPDKEKQEAAPPSRAGEYRKAQNVIAEHRRTSQASDDEAARARRQVEEEFKRIEEERRFAAERETEFERRKQIAALEGERRRLDERERAVDEEINAIRRRIEDLRSDMAAELEARLSAAGRDIDEKIERLARQAFEMHSAEISTAFQEMDHRLSALAERLDRKAADGADEDKIAAIANLVAERVNEQRAALDAAVLSLSSRIDSLAGDRRNAEEIGREFEELKQALEERGPSSAAPIVQLSDIIRNALPPDAFEMRALLSNNRRADCLVRLPHPPGPMAIDAQFPVEAHYRLQSQHGDNASHAESEFRRAALRHIADVAERLIQPGETADSAMLFVPSESIYSDLHARFPDVIQDSYRAHVWIVSPTTLMAALHTMRAALRILPDDAAASRELDRRVVAELDALRQRISDLEHGRERAPRKDDAMAENSPSPIRAENEASKTSITPSHEKNGDGKTPDDHADANHPQERKDSSKGDLWDDDHGPEKTHPPFPLR